MNEGFWKQLSAFYDLTDDPWTVEILLVILLMSAIHGITSLILKRLAIKVEKTANFWDDAILYAARRPIILFVWVMAVLWVLQILEANFQQIATLSVVESWCNIGVIVLLSWFLMRLIMRTEIHLLADSQRDMIDRATVTSVAKLLRVVVFTIAVLLAMQSFGISITGVLAFGGVGGVAVGFAAKDLLANFFGGLVIFLDRPFAVGDWIRSPDQEIEGTVETIGWRRTAIRTFDKRPLYIPNAVFSHISVENPSRMRNRRIYETIGLRFEDIGQVESIINAVRTMLETHDEIDNKQTLIVNFNALGPSSLDFFVYTFTNTTDWVYFHKVKQEILLRIVDIVFEHGAALAYPTSTIKMDGLLPAGASAENIDGPEPGL